MQISWFDVSCKMRFASRFFSSQGAAPFPRRKGAGMRGECQFRVNAVSAGKKCNLTGGNTGSRVAVKNIYWRETVLENRGGSLVSIVSVGEHVYRM